MGRIMPKALLVLLGLVSIGVGVLHSRQQSLELRYRAAQVHREIQKSQAELWRQQLEIASYTSPQVMQTVAATFQKPPSLEDLTQGVDAARE